MSAKNSKARKHTRRQSAVVRLRSAYDHAKSLSESYESQANKEKNGEQRNDLLATAGDYSGKMIRIQKAIDNTEAKL